MNKLLLLLVFFLSVGLYAQSDTLVVKKDNSILVQKKYSKETIKAYKADKDFQYEESLIEHNPSFIERFFNWLGRQFVRFVEWLFGVKYAKGILATLLKSIPYLIAALVLFLLFKFFRKVNSNSIVSTGANQAIVSYTDEEDLIKNKDLGKLIQQAIDNKNYRLAIRYYYLQLLQKLQENEVITWEQQKTNNDYNKEITQLELKTNFTKLTRLYDFVWYGNFEINEFEFEKSATEFQQTQQLIRKK